MIRLDSLDLTCDTSPLPAIDRSRMRLQESTDPETGETRSAYTVRDTGLQGLYGVKATETAVSFRLSAQAMGNRYSDGISSATLDELCDRITDTGLVSVTPDQLRAATVRRADPFADVYAADLPSIPEALRLIGRTSGEGTRVKGRGDAVTLYSQLPGKEGLLRTYDKGSQLGLAKQRPFAEAYPEAVRRLEGYRRTELATQSYHAARRIAGLAQGTPILADVLDSTLTPVSTSLSQLLDTWTGRRRTPLSLSSLPASSSMFLAMPSASPNDTAFAILYTMMAEWADGDYDAACALARAKFGSKHAHRHYPGLRSACEAYGSPAESEPKVEAIDVLTALSSRIREREQS